MEIIRWSGWSDRQKPAFNPLRTPVGKVYIHHTVSPTAANIEAEKSMLRGIDRQHRNQGWSGIGYNFIIGPSGNVYEGRGFTIGAQNDGENSSSIGIAFLGDHRNHVPRPAAMTAARELLWHLRNINAITPTYALRAHGRRGDGSPYDGTDATVCPGDALYRALPTLKQMVEPTPSPGEPMPDIPIVNAPIVGVAMTGDGQGYILVSADGGVFAFGTAKYLGRVEYRLPAGKSWVPSG